MSKTARRLTRILSMVPWVIANQGASVAEVCRRFGYTERELIEDLNLVFVCGLPGYGPVRARTLSEKPVVIAR